jgi:hypothetical protein
MISSTLQHHLFEYSEIVFVKKYTVKAFSVVTDNGLMLVQQLLFYNYFRRRYCNSQEDHSRNNFMRYK